MNKLFSPAALASQILYKMDKFVVVVCYYPLNYDYEIDVSSYVLSYRDEWFSLKVQGILFVIILLWCHLAA